MWKRHGGKNQKWNILYVDEKKEVQKKGLVEDYGFHANRPFYIMSRLPMKRVAECHGANNLWIRRWRKNTAAQQFFFDVTSKTIRSQQWKNYAMEI